MAVKKCIYIYENMVLVYSLFTSLFKNRRNNGTTRHKLCVGQYIDAAQYDLT